MRHRRRGVTLIEVLVALALVTLLTGGMMMGMGALTSARLREGSTLIMAAVNAAYNHANATSRATRVVIDFGTRTVAIEDSPGRMLLQSGSRTGGAASATELERAASEEAEAIVEGPRAPRAEFRAVTNLLGFSSDKSKAAVKTLPDGVYFRQVEVEHEDTPATEERVYVYFWPGGQTERAAIQLQKGNADAAADDIMTLTIAPLTGKVRMFNGALEMARPRSDEEASEREDFGF
ncbi:MAG TPA: prepilin-type N-terminal cleavage/methylation domain-containing protein [Sorangium sp.]|nr:prepilin-type N-terminal cleavage/methylation domain-containing protein [Sorangium sp.]